MKPIKPIGEIKNIDKNYILLNSISSYNIDEENDYERKLFILRTMLISQNILTEEQIDELIGSYEILNKLTE